MKKFSLFSSMLALLILPNLSLADHTPKKMMRNMKAFSQLGETGQLGPFTVNVDKFGQLPKKENTLVENKRYDNIFADKFNIATIIMKGNDVVYERYNNKRRINSNTPLQGMSMSKTAVSATVGQILCDGKIKSLNDPAGGYSPTLNSSPSAATWTHSVSALTSFLIKGTFLVRNSISFSVCNSKIVFCKNSLCVYLYF